MKAGWGLATDTSAERPSIKCFAINHHLYYGAESVPVHNIYTRLCLRAETERMRERDGGAVPPKSHEEGKEEAAVSMYACMQEG